MQIVEFFLKIFIFGKYDKKKPMANKHRMRKSPPPAPTSAEGNSTLFCELYFERDSLMQLRWDKCSPLPYNLLSGCSPSPTLKHQRVKEREARVFVARKRVLGCQFQWLLSNFFDFRKSLLWWVGVWIDWRRVGGLWYLDRFDFLDSRIC